MVVIVACSEKPGYEEYEGDPLEIAVVGNPPEIREEQISFKEITLKELVDEDLDYDAVFITPNNLSEAAENKYADVYIRSGIPFFFIESTKTYHPFVNKDLSYQDAKERKSITENYITGFMSTNEDKSRDYFYFQLNDEKVTDKNVKAIYSDVFTKIAKLAYPQSK